MHSWSPESPCPATRTVFSTMRLGWPCHARSDLSLGAPSAPSVLLLFVLTLPFDSFCLCPHSSCFHLPPVPSESPLPSWIPILCHRPFTELSLHLLKKPWLYSAFVPFMLSLKQKFPGYSKPRRGIGIPWTPQCYFHRIVLASSWKSAFFPS